MKSLHSAKEHLKKIVRYSGFHLCQKYTPVPMLGKALHHEKLLSPKTAPRFVDDLIARPDIWKVDEKGMRVCLVELAYQQKTRYPRLVRLFGNKDHSWYHGAHVADALERIDRVEKSPYLSVRCYQNLRRAFCEKMAKADMSEALLDMKAFVYSNHDEQKIVTFITVPPFSLERLAMVPRG